MRQVLIEPRALQARASLETYRLEGKLDADRLAADDDRVVDLLALDSAMTKLRGESDALVRLVELHFFAGLSFAEIAELEACSLSTVERNWRTTRAWLHAHMRDDRD